MKIRKKNINFRFKKSKLKSKNEKSIMQRSYIIFKTRNTLCFTEVKLMKTSFIATSTMIKGFLLCKIKY